MLVDDQAMVRVGFRMILESEADLTVVGEAADGHAAVELADRCRPDVILMDVRMPVIDGPTATRLIRNTEGPNRAVPIIGVTANTGSAERSRYLESGMTDCIAKPIDAGTLLSAVQHATALTG